MFTAVTPDRRSQTVTVAEFCERSLEDSPIALAGGKTKGVLQ
jgi:hypothetical protein